MKEEYHPSLCPGISNELVLDGHDSDNDSDMQALVDSSDSEVEEDGCLDDLGGKMIVDDEGKRTHRVICSNGSVRSNYACKVVEGGRRAVPRCLYFVATMLSTRTSSNSCIQAAQDAMARLSSFKCVHELTVPGENLSDLEANPQQP